MGYYSRLSKAFEGALKLPLTGHSKYILMSDCHRGTGTSYDNFLKNQNLYFAALQYYYHRGFTYIELGDGDELWENPDMEQIIETHSNVFWLFSLFHRQGRLHMLYGNHDMMKKNGRYTAKACTTYYCSEEPLLPGLKFHSGIILEASNERNNFMPMDIYLTHGHQTDFLNSVFWRLAKFLVRHLWRPLERFGVLDPTSAAKNYTRKSLCEKRLHHWAQKENHILIAGHTHRPILSAEDSFYYNCGSCVHPRCITCLEIERYQICLVKWTLGTKPDRTLYVRREILAGPKHLER